MIESVSGALVAGVLTYLERHGVETAELSSRMGVARGETPTSYVPVADYLSLLAHLTTALDDDAGVLRYAAKVSMSHVSMLGMIMEGAHTMEDALAALLRYSALAYASDAPDGGIGLVRQGDRAWLTLGELDQHRHLAEESVARLVLGPRRFLDRPHVIAAHFSYPAPPYWRHYTSILGCPVEFDMAATAIEIPPDLGAWPVAQVPAAVVAILRRHADAELEALDEGATIATRVAAIIGDCLPGPIPGAAQVADALHMSRSTLARRLAAQGTTYSQVVWQARAAIAQELLATTDATVASISSRLGYSESAAFIRAFTAREGVSPTRYRTRLGFTTKR